MYLFNVIDKRNNRVVAVIAQDDCTGHPPICMEEIDALRTKGFDLVDAGTLSVLRPEYAHHIREHLLRTYERAVYPTLFAKIEDERNETSG